jgi:Ca2+-binding RTX toxin-like protein
MADPNVVTGTSGNDLLHGTTGDDTIYGLAGDDYIDPGGSGTDILYGGTGNDSYADYGGIDGHPLTLVEKPNEGTDTILAYTSTGIPANIENLVMMGHAQFAAWGNDLDNVITGNDAANYIFGGVGADSMIGGKGNDSYGIDNPGDKVIETAGGGFDDVNVSAANSIVYTLTAGQEIEKLSCSNNHAYGLIGNEFDNIILGNDFENFIDGDGGSDSLRGGGGNDVYVVDNPGDAILEFVGAGNDTVLAHSSYTLQDEVSIETMRAFDLASTDAITLTGNNLANAIYGNAGDDILMGAGGNDTLVGNGGFDRLYGGTGDDIFVVTTGNDVIEGANGGTDHVLTEQDFALTTGQEIEWLQARYQDSTTGLTLIGNEYGNHIVGAAGDDVLAGKEGDDTLAGLGGVDLLKGGTGADRFVFRDGDTGATAATADTIADFGHAQGDRIDLSQIDANTGVAGNQAFTLHASGDDHVAGALWLTQSGNDALVNMDTNGDGQADYLLHLADLKAASLVAADFVF